MKDKIQPSVADVAMAVTSLLNNGHDELAFKVNDLLGVKVGKFFYERAVACYMVGDCFETNGSRPSLFYLLPGVS